MEKYKVVLKTSGKRYAKEGKSILEGLQAMPLDWHNIKAKGTITVYQGKSKYELLFTLQRLKGIFMNKLTMQLWAKRLNVLLESKKV